MSILRFEHPSDGSQSANGDLNGSCIDFGSEQFSLSSSQYCARPERLKAVIGTIDWVFIWASEVQQTAERVISFVFEFVIPDNMLVNAITNIGV